MVKIISNLTEALKLAVGHFEITPAPAPEIAPAPAPEITAVPWTAERFRELISHDKHEATYESRGQIESLSKFGADLMNFVAENQLELTHKFKERNFSFYFGRRLVFGINLHARTSRLCVWLPERDILEREEDWIDSGDMSHRHEGYYDGGRCAVYPREAGVTDIAKMLEFAYLWRSGELFE